MSYEMSIPGSWVYSGRCFTDTWINIITVKELAWKHNGQEHKAGNNCKSILFSGGLTELLAAEQCRKKNRRSSEVKLEILELFFLPYR